MSAREVLAALIESSGSLPCHASDQVNLTNARGIADTILASDWLAKHDAEVGERIAVAIEAEWTPEWKALREKNLGRGVPDLARFLAEKIAARATTTTEVGL